MKLDQFVTEGVNQNTIDIDQRNAFEIVSLMNREDQLVALAVEQELRQQAAIPRD